MFVSEQETKKQNILIHLAFKNVLEIFLLNQYIKIV